MSTITSITLNPADNLAPTKDTPASSLPDSLPDAKVVHTNPSQTPLQNGDDAKIYFIGTATTVIEYHGLRILTDPNFLHAGDHVHLGPGVTAQRQTNPAVDLHDLPRIDMILLSHFHADHFDQHVIQHLRKNIPIISTPHAKENLNPLGFVNVYALDVWEEMQVEITDKEAKIKITGMPGKHVPPNPISALNELLGAVPPTNGWIVDLITSPAEADAPYRIYISGDTLLVDDLKEIPHRFPDVDLMLIHLGGTTIPSKSLPLLMVTMDAKQGIQLLQIINPDVTIPIHYDDYDLFLSPLEDFKKEVQRAGVESKVVYLDRGDQYKFNPKGKPKTKKQTSIQSHIKT